MLCKLIKTHVLKKLSLQKLQHDTRPLKFRSSGQRGHGLGVEESCDHHGDYLATRNNNNDALI